VTDIIPRLKEPETHYPGNFDTPKRANAMLSCLCQEAAEEIESLRQKLAGQNEYYENVMQDGGNRIKALRQQLAEKNAEIERLKSTPPEKREDLRCVISDLCDQVRERDQQLAASQAREQQLREALSKCESVLYNRDRFADDVEAHKAAVIALSLPADTTALQSMIAKAGEVMLERCASEFNQQHVEYFGDTIQLAIRTIPAVTIEDLKGGAA